MNHDLPQPDLPSRRVRLAAAVGLFLAVTALSGAATALFFYHSAYTRLNAQLSRERSLGSTASTLAYGKIVSVHPLENSVVASIANSFAPSEEPRLVLLQITRDTFIARQELTGDRGLLYALSPRTPATLADLQAGMNVAFLLENRSRTRDTVARVILVGNPL
jgi:hypothetical protein